MGKRILNLYVDDEIVALAKSKNINLSQFFINALNVELNLDETNDNNELILKLKLKIAKLSDELREMAKNRELLEKDIIELNKKLKENKKDGYDDDGIVVASRTWKR